MMFEYFLSDEFLRETNEIINKMANWQETHHYLVATGNGEEMACIKCGLHLPDPRMTHSCISHLEEQSEVKP